jgi:hypothetical protein
MAIEMYGRVISTCEELQSAVKLHNARLNHFTRQAKILRDVDSVKLFILFLKTVNLFKNIALNSNA